MVGVSFDEEAAQFALGGNVPFRGAVDPHVRAVVNGVLMSRHKLIETWEKEHPGKNPYPRSFPERALKLLREALEESYREGGGSPQIQLTLLINMCEKELDAGPVSVASPDEEL
jgi:hypothetical protein